VTSASVLTDALGSERPSATRVPPAGPGKSSHFTRWTRARSPGEAIVPREPRRGTTRAAQGCHALDGVVNGAPNFGPTLVGPLEHRSDVGDPLSTDLAALRIDRAAPRGPKPYARIAVTAALIAAAAGGVYTLVLPRLTNQIFQQEVSATEIAMVSPVQSTVTVTSTGYVVPQVVSKVGAKVPGRVAKVNVKEGDTIKAGQVIATLEDSDQRSAIAAAVSRVGVAHAYAQTARANLADIDQQVKREQSLVASGAAGRATLEDLQARQKSLDEQVKAADSEARASQSDVDSLQTTLGDRTILSPIDGTIVAKPVEVGEMVVPAGNPVAEVADFKSLLVETDVPEARLQLVKKGGPAEIVLDAYPDRRYRGEVAEFGQKVNRAKATLVVKVKFVDDLSDVLPEMAARVAFLNMPEKGTAQAVSRVTVPVAAVLSSGKTGSVFVIGEEGKIEKRDVALGLKTATNVTVLSGISAGERLAGDNLDKLHDGDKVKVGE